MSAVTRLCRRAILLHQGQMLEDSDVLQIVSRYLATIRTATGTQSWPDAAAAPGNAVVRLRQARVVSDDHATTDTLDIRRPMGIELIYDVLTPGHILIPNLHFHNDEGSHIFAVQDVSSEWRRRPRPPGRYTSTAWLPGNLLAEGRLTVDVHISSHRPETVIHAQARRVLTFQVVDRLEEGSARGDYTGPFPGVVRPMANWETEAELEVLLDRMPAD
jgi:lipopolysaccharide transport system ATP-binding protein